MTDDASTAGGIGAVGTRRLRTVADLERFVDEFGANHLQLAPGDYRVELAEFCRLNGIEFRQYTGGEF